MADDDNGRRLQILANDTHDGYYVFRGLGQNPVKVFVWLCTRGDDTFRGEDDDIV